MKKPYKSRTMGWVLILTLLAAVLTIPEVRAVVPPEAMPWFLAIAAAITGCLRIVTTTPLG